MPIPKVAIVIDGGSPHGRAIALALAARGTSIIVAGAEERALGETVGEIAFGGGKARHVVGDMEAAIRRAAEVFSEPLDVIVTIDEKHVTLLRGARGFEGLKRQADPDESARSVVELLESLADA